MTRVTARFICLAARAVLGASLLLTTDIAGAQAPARAALPGWMAGCWERTSGNRVVEEHWLAPRGGMMLGVGRTTRGDSVVEYEHTRIYARGDTLVFAATPSGQAPAEFRAVGPVGAEVRFENLAHDFPQRVIYRRRGADSLFARVEGTRGGQTRGFDFAYGRVSCPAGGNAPK
jgi:hypothetical protein